MKNVNLDKADLESRLQRGQTFRVIASELGVCLPTLRTQCRELGIAKVYKTSCVCECGYPKGYSNARCMKCSLDAREEAVKQSQLESGKVCPACQQRKSRYCFYLDKRGLIQ